MKLGLLVMFALPAASVAFADDAPPAPKPAEPAISYPDYKEFALVVERNVFDTKRKSASAAEAAKDAAAPPPQELVVLTGTVIRDDEARALFEGGADTPKEGLKLGDSIAGFKLAEVRIDGIALTNDAGTIQLPVGAGLAKDEKGEWKTVDNPAPAASAPEPPSNDGAAAPSAEKSESQGKDEDKAAEKLRKRRRKELGL